MGGIEEPRYMTLGAGTGGSSSFTHITFHIFVLTWRATPPSDSKLMERYHNNLEKYYFSDPSIDSNEDMEEQRIFMYWIINLMQLDMI